MNILAGIAGRSPVWEHLLQREGLPWSTVNLATGDGVEGCSVIIVTAPCGPAERDVLAAYLRQGGAVLAAAAHVSGLGGTTVRREPLAHLIGEHDTAFPTLRLMDLEVEGMVAREARHLRTPANTHAVVAGGLAGGVAVLLPFDPVWAFTDARVADRAFFARHDRLPTERVSCVSRGEVSQLLHHALAFLHHARSMPYLHLWYYPGTRRNVLSFRIDTDGAPRKDIDDLFHMLEEHDVPATWFLDVAAHESWLGHFGDFTGHEMGVHCYRHRIYADLAEQEADWQRGIAVSRSVGLAPAGSAAPFGTWTPALAGVIDRLGLLYSSEFSFAYDTFPLMPFPFGNGVRTLQVPIHPVSTGSLRRAGFTSARMRSYFASTADALLARDLPLAFYHHPSHRELGVFASLFDHVRSHGIEPMRMDAIAHWWSGRLAVKADVRLQGTTATIDNDEALRRADIAVHVLFPDGSDAIVPAARELDHATMPRERRPAPVVPEDIRAIREFDPRRAFGDLFVSLLRRFT